MMMVVGPIGGYLFGAWLDRKWGTDPYLMIAMLILGFAASGRETFKLIRQLQKDTDKK